MSLKICINKIQNYFLKGHKRSIRAKKNILATFIIKGLNIATGLILVPLTIDYLNPTKYGIWITLSSMIAWFGFFDIGLGHGLRNRFAEALAAGKNELARTYVSTTYALLSIIIASILVLFYSINKYLNWAYILNTGGNANFEKELNLLAIIVFTFFCFRFLVRLIATILIADQQPAKASLFDLHANILSLLIIFILTRTTEGSLLYLGITLSSLPFIVFFIANLWFFNGKYKNYKPSIKLIDFSKIRDLFSLGIKFFIIQIAALLLYQTNNIIIAQLFGPAQVTPYNVAFKYFSILMMIFSIIVSPFWSAFTEAWVKKEVQWIRNIMRKLFTFWVILAISGILMFLCSQWIYEIWVGDKVNIPYSISALVGTWVLFNAWIGIFSQFLNGVGRVNLQMYLSITAAIINVPLAIFLGKKMGIEGVLITNLLVLSIGIWIYPLQYYKIINSKASGIWNR